MNRAFAWPVGQGRQDQSPIALTVLYMAGLIIGGMLTGIILMLVAFAATVKASSVAMMAVIGVMGLAIALEMTGRMGPFPQIRRQVAKARLEQDWRIAAPVFGIQLGMGVVTYIRHPAAYVPVLFGVALVSPPILPIAGAIFGASRGAPLVWNRLRVRSLGEAEGLEASTLTGTWHIRTRRALLLISTIQMTIALVALM